MSPEFERIILMLGALGFLTLYEIRRKFPQDRHTFNLMKLRDWIAWLDRNWPRILFTVVLIPGTGQVLTDLISKLAQTNGG